MSNTELVRLLEDLRAHIEQTRRERPGADEEQAVHNFLSRYDLSVTEHFADQLDCPQSADETEDNAPQCTHRHRQHRAFYASTND
jgi:hypothetical protein